MKKIAKISLMGLSALWVTQAHMVTMAGGVEDLKGKPNIILLISDDQGYADFGANGQAKDVKTPALDDLANMGVRFTNAYVTAPICNASRAGIITGSYQQRFGVKWYGGEGLRDKSFKTIAEVLKGQGYRTGYFGKFHYASPKHEGQETRNFPLSHGFDELVGFSGGRKHYLYHDVKSEKSFKDKLAKIDTGYEGLQMQPFWVNREKKDKFGYSTEIIGKAARDFMDKNKDQPFFAQVAFNAVHNFTHQLPKEYLKKHGLKGYPGDWDPTNEKYLDWYQRGRFPNNSEGRAQYLGHVEYLDREIGRIMDHLKEKGMLENTIVIFLSDNGGSTPIYANNAPYRGSKYTLYEGGIRVPMIIAAPGRFKGGQSIDNLVSAMDILPTVASAAHAVIPVNIDGLDLTALLTGEDKDLGHEALIWDTGSEFAVRFGRWKYRSGGDLENAKIEMVELETGEFLHDLDADPAEQKNLAKTHPKVLEKMKNILKLWQNNIK